MTEWEPQSAADVLAYLEEAVGELGPTMEQAEEIWKLMRPCEGTGSMEGFETSRLLLAVQAWDRGRAFCKLLLAARDVLDNPTGTNERERLAAIVDPLREHLDANT